MAETEPLVWVCLSRGRDAFATLLPVWPGGKPGPGHGGDQAWMTSLSPAAREGGEYLSRLWGEGSCYERWVPAPTQPQTKGKECSCGETEKTDVPCRERTECRGRGPGRADCHLCLGSQATGSRGTKGTVIFWMRRWSCWPFSPRVAGRDQRSPSNASELSAGPSEAVYLSTDPTASPGLGGRAGSCIARGRRCPLWMERGLWGHAVTSVTQRIELAFMKFVPGVCFCTERRQKGSSQRSSQ